MVESFFLPSLYLCCFLQHPLAVNIPPRPGLHQVPEVVPSSGIELYFPRNAELSTLFFFFLHFLPHEPNPSTHAQILHIAATSEAIRNCVSTKENPPVKTSGRSLLEPGIHFGYDRECENLAERNGNFNKTLSPVPRFSSLFASVETFAFASRILLLPLDPLVRLLARDDTTTFLLM